MTHNLESYLRPHLSPDDYALLTRSPCEQIQVTEDYQLLGADRLARFNIAVLLGETAHKPIVYQNFFQRIKVPTRFVHALRTHPQILKGTGRMSRRGRTFHFDLQIRLRGAPPPRHVYRSPSRRPDPAAELRPAAEHQGRFAELKTAGFKTEITPGLQSRRALMQRAASIQEVSAPIFENVPIKALVIGWLVLSTALGLLGYGEIASVVNKLGLGLSISAASAILITGIVSVAARVIHRNAGQAAWQKRSLAGEAAQATCESLRAKILPALIAISAVVLIGALSTWLTGTTALPFHANYMLPAGCVLLSSLAGYGLSEVGSYTLRSPSYGAEAWVSAKNDQLRLLAGLEEAWQLLENPQDVEARRTLSNIYRVRTQDW